MDTALIDALMPRASNPTAGSAVVTAVNDGTVDISFSGATVTAACLESYANRAVDDVVFVIPTRGGYVVLGRYTQPA